MIASFAPSTVAFPAASLSVTLKTLPNVPPPITEPATDASAIDAGAPATVKVIVVVLSPAAYAAPAAVAEAAETPTRTVYVPATSAVRETLAGTVVP